VSGEWRWGDRKVGDGARVRCYMLLRSAAGSVVAVEHATAVRARWRFESGFKNGCGRSGDLRGKWQRFFILSNARWPDGCVRADGGPFGQVLRPTNRRSTYIISIIVFPFLWLLRCVDICLVEFLV
jgi:hypothetical protein